MSYPQNDIKDTRGVQLRPIAQSQSEEAFIYSSLLPNDIDSKSSHHDPIQRSSRTFSSSWVQTPNQILSNTAWFRRHFWIDTWHDVKQFPYTWLARRFISHFLPPSVLLCLVALLVLMSVQPTNFLTDIDNVCKPDGSFKLLGMGEYTPWQRGAIFAINSNFGSYSFSVAKLIDIIWDVGMGRGGQAFLAIFTYIVFTKGLSRTMEASSVTLDTFEAVTLRGETVSSLLTLVKDLLKTAGVRPRVAMAWTILSASFVIVVPTWLSAATGYTADLSAYVQDRTGNLVPARNFRPVIYTIHDAARLGDGYKNDTMFSLPWEGSDDQLYMADQYGCASGIANYSSSGPDYIEWIDDYFDYTGIDCKWLWATSKYVFDYGFLGVSTATNTTFQVPDASNITKPLYLQPPLNISANFAASEFDPSDLYANPWNFLAYGRTWQDPVTGLRPFATPDPIFWDNTSDTVYHLAEFNVAGNCQPQNTIQYKWGFSFILLYAFVATFLVWTLGMWAFYLDTWLHSRLDLSHREMGIQRAVLDMSRAMESRLDKQEVLMYSASQLKVALRDTTVTHSDLPLILPPVTRWIQLKWWWRGFNFKEWLKHERWWLYAMTLFTLFFVLSWTSTTFSNRWLPWASVLPGSGICLVLAAGRAARSRWVIFAVFFLLFWLPECWYLSRSPYYYDD